jgi:protein AroM
VGMLGVVTIGQTPRPDLVEVFERHAPGAEIRVAGALDGLSPGEVEALAVPDAYPLLVRLADGGTARVPLATLAPRVERRARELADQGAAAIVVACAGAFPAIHCGAPVLLPGTLLPGVVRAVTRTGRIGIVTPLEGQVRAAREKWTDDGFHVKVTWASPYDEAEMEAAVAAMRDPSLEVVVLDCMGHGDEYRDRFAERCGRPVVLAQSIVARVAGGLVS